MIKKLTPNDIKKCIEGTTLANYCNGIEFDSEALNRELGESNIALSNLVKLEYTGIEYFDISTYIRDSKDKDGEKQLILIFDFRINSVQDKLHYVVTQDGYDKLISDLASLVYLITEGMKAVAELNKIIAEKQNQHGSSVIISYRWCITDRFCKIGDWNYDMIRIKLSKPSILQLIDLVESGKLDEFIDISDFNKSIKQFILGFNKNSLHEKISAVLGSNSIERILTENMLSTEDVVAYLKRNLKRSGTQDFKTVEFISELGKFVVIADWKVDYTNHRISIKISNNKVFDVENDRFTSDEDIVDRVEKRINISKKLESSIFN